MLCGAQRVNGQAAAGVSGLAALVHGAVHRIIAGETAFIAANSLNATLDSIAKRTVVADAVVENMATQMRGEIAAIQRAIQAVCAIPIAFT